MAMNALEQLIVDNYNRAQYPDDAPVTVGGITGAEPEALPAEALATPAEPVARQPAQQGQAEIKSYDPTMRERLSSFLQAGFQAVGYDKYKAREVSQGIVGGPSSPFPVGFGLGDIAAMFNPAALAAMTPAYIEEGARAIERAGEAYKRGDIGQAAIEGVAGAADVVPGVFGAAAGGLKLLKNVPDGMAGKISKGGLYETRQDGDFYRVGKTGDAGSRPSDAGSRQGAGVDGIYPGTAIEVRTPERRQSVYGNQERPIDEAVQDRLTPQNNPALRVANEYNQATFNAPYNYDIKIEPSSLRKQSAVGVAYELAAKRTPGYADAVFNAYKADPELGPIIENMGIKSYDELVQASYKQMEKETIDQFRKLPISLSYHQGPGTYLDSKEMLRDVHLHNHMYVYQGGDPHEFLNVVDPETGLNSNEIFRAVHDYFGHAIKGNQFGPKGEEVAWASHAQMYSPLARLAMTAETRGQNSFVNYTPINAELTKKMESVRVRQKELIRAGKRDEAEKLAETLRGLGGQWQYAEQASVLLPPEMTRMDYAGGIPDYLRKLQTPEGLTMEAEHYSRVQGLEQLDPGQYGTGAPGREAERLESAGAQKPRSFFYEAGAQPEPEVISISKGKYKGKLEGLYDFDADPLGLNKIASVANTNSVMSKINAGVRNESSRMNDLERMIYERGYRGYVSGEKGSRRAVVFEPTQVQEVK